MATENKKINNRKVRVGSVSWRVLEYLYWFTLLPRVDTDLLFPDSKDSTVDTAVKTLISYGFIEPFKKTKDFPVTLRLTKDGVAFLENRSDYYYKHRTTGPNWYSDGQYTLFMRRGKVATMMKSMNYLCAPNEKPTMAKLLTAITKYEYEEGEVERNAERYVKLTEERDAVKILEQGVYYSPQEVRNTLRAFEGSEATNKSRFCGILLLKDRMYVLFNTMQRLMKWYDAIEKRTLSMVSTLFDTYPAYSKYFRGGYEKEPVPAIVFGNSTALLPALVMGYRHGHIKDVGDSKNPKTRGKYNLLSARSQAYKVMYFVPATRKGRDTLKRALELNGPRDLTKQGDDFFRANSQFVPRAKEGLRRGTEFKGGEFGLDAAYCAVPEIMSLGDMRNATAPVHIVTTPELSDAMARAIGPTVEAMSDPSGSALQYTKYGFNGYPKGKYPAVRRKSTREKAITTFSLKIPINTMNFVSGVANTDKVTKTSVLQDLINRGIESWENDRQETSIAEMMAKGSLIEEAYYDDLEDEDDEDEATYNIPQAESPVYDGYDESGEDIDAKTKETLSGRAQKSL